MWLLLDNHDSFTHILHHYLLAEHADVRVVESDSITAADVVQLAPDRVILSPGPQTPSEAGCTLEVIRALHHNTPILGVCLGHQALGQYFGADVRRAPEPRHGYTSPIAHEGHPLFAGLPQPFEAMRYHSLALENVAGTGLRVIGRATDDGTVQAIAHDVFPCVGVQFHPESVGTGCGATIIRAWAGMYGSAA